MDRKGLLILGGAFVAFIAYLWGVNRMFPASPHPSTATNAAVAPLLATNGSPRRPGSNGGGIPALSSGRPEKSLALENDYLRATFTSDGGGLKLLEFKKYPAEIPRHKGDPTHGFATLNGSAFLPAFVFGGNEALEGRGGWELVPEGSTLRSSKTLASGVRVVKTFALTNNYEFGLTVRVENASNRPVVVPEQELVVGTASPMDARERSDYQGVYWFNGSKAEHVDQNKFLGSGFGCWRGEPRHEYRTPQGQSNVFWAAVHNRFFTLITAPEQPAASLVVWDYPLAAPSADSLAADGRLNPNPRAHQAGLVYPSAILAPGEALERHYHLYAGPKEYFNLSRIEPQFDRVMEFTGITGFFAKGLLLSLNGLHQIIPSYGWCIVAITVLVKALFWPLTAASARSAKRMQAMQPELQAMREKYKDNPRKFQEKNLELMKRHGVNPAMGCLPMLIQIPVFIGFVFMVRTAIELRGERFWWAWDLSQPDTLFYIPGLGSLPFVGVAGLGLPVNLLPLVMVVTSLWLSSFTPPSPQMDPAQQKMMRYMPAFFVVFFYNYSSGLTLYWTVQNLISALQAKLTRAKDPALAEAAAGPVRKKR